MSRTQTQQRPQAPARELSNAEIFDRVMEMPVTEKQRQIDAALTARIPKIEEMLPDFMKGQGERVVKRATLTFGQNKDLQDGCPPADFVRCVLEAAELGFAIDGKMAYVVKYKTRYQLQLDYKALIAVAKRCRTIIDIDADIVCENDQFRHGKFSDKTVLDHTYQLGQDRGETIGAYCRVFLPGGQYNYGLMDRASLDKIEAMSKAKYDGRPWQEHKAEQQKKTVIRRTLKLYQDDPGLMRMLEITGWEDEEPETSPKPTTLDELSAALTAPPKQAIDKPKQARQPADDGPPRDYADAGEADAGNQTKATDAIDTDLLDLAKMDLGVATDEPGVGFTLKELLDRPMNEATATAIKELASDRRKALRGPTGRDAVKQKELAK